MAKEYSEKLSRLVSALKLEEEIALPIEIKHFFSGAALHVNKKICASWSPAGLAFKLPEHTVQQLITNGKATPLKYFLKGHIKKDYALFENPDLSSHVKWKQYFIQAAEQTKAVK